MKSEFEDAEAIREKIESIPEELPILPLRDAVIFPTAVMPLTVGRESSVQLVNDVQDSNGLLAVLTQRDKSTEAPGPEDLYDTGTVSVIHRVMRTPEGNLFVIVMAIARMRIVEFTQFEPYLRARMEVLPDDAEEAVGGLWHFVIHRIMNASRI